MDTEELVTSLRFRQKQKLKSFHLKKIDGVTLYYQEDKSRFAVYYRKKGDKLKYLSANPKKVQEFINKLSYL